ncbi:MAG: alpha-galactosidase [Acetatifactor sp.]|nr:alpha-galactosidase [Acetatifactor sp.]
MNQKKEYQNESEFIVQVYENRVTCTCEVKQCENDVWEYHCRMTPDEREEKRAYNSPAKIAMFAHYNEPGVAIHIIYPGAGVAGLWRPDAGLSKSLPPDWIHPQCSNISHSAPVLCYFGYENENIMTVSLSETRYDVELRGAVNEETGELHTDLMIPLAASVYEFVLRIDVSKISFSNALSEVSEWWDRYLEDKRMPASNVAREPMYSTWYSYHQNVCEETLLEQCRLAVSYGMNAVILDDGWQTNDANRGYKYCGDWQVMPEKFPDFRGFVQKLHDMRMKCLVWFSVPYMGSGAEAYADFAGMLLHFDAAASAGILDPRYPEVREYLIKTYASFLEKYDVDGFKLDFIDCFAEYDDTPAYNENMDYVRVQDAVYSLMIDVSNALKRQKQDIMIEFRQSYIGPSIQRFGNLFRVGDCPMSDVNNRVGIADLKLMSPSLCVHSDMLMWHPTDSPKHVALHLLNCIFSTLQISVDLKLQTEENKKVLAHYLNFARTYAGVLQEGHFEASFPLQNYATMQSFLDGTLILGAYVSGLLVKLSDSYQGCTLKEAHLLNGSGGDKMYALLPNGRYTCEVFSPTGGLVKEVSYAQGGYVCLPVPCGGRVFLRRFSN